MVILLNKELKEKVEEIVKYIQESDSYKNYIQYKGKLNENKELLEEIKNIKKNQQMLIKNPKLKKECEERIQKSLDILNNDVIYIQYLAYQDDVNNILNIFENKINKYFEEVFR